MQESYEVGYEKEKQGRSVIRSKNQNSGVVNGNKFVAVIWLRQKSRQRQQIRKHWIMHTGYIS